MALSFLEIVNTGQTTFPIPFALGILDREYVTVQVNSEIDGNGEPLFYTDWSWVDDANITINNLTNGDTITIRRTIPKNLLVSPFTEGASITRRNLDKQSRQLMMLIHEACDRFDELQDATAASNEAVNGIVIGNVPLTGTAPAGSSLGINTLTGQIYAVIGGNWFNLPDTINYITTDW